MNSFEEVVKSRRSANKFVKGVTIGKKDIDEILELVTMAPSCYNLQHAHYHIGLNPEMVHNLYEASQQYKVSTASAVVIVTGDKRAYENAEQIYEGYKFLNIIDQDELNDIVSDITLFHKMRDDDFLHDEGIRNGALSAMLFMLCAKEKGWDTCPMIFFDEAKVRELMHIPEREEIVMMIPIGIMDEKSVRLRGYRKPISEFARYY